MHRLVLLICGWVKERGTEIIYHGITLPILVLLCGWVLEQLTRPGLFRDISVPLVMLSLIWGAIFFIAKRPTFGFNVLHAFFGIDHRWENVTKQIKKQVKNGQLNMINPIEGEKLPEFGFPDPAPGKEKDLIVVYSVSGKLGIVVAKPREQIYLPERQ